MLEFFSVLISENVRGERHMLNGSCEHCLSDDYSCCFLAGIPDDLGGEMHFFPPPTKPDPQVNFVPQTWSSNRNASVATACITRCGIEALLKKYQFQLELVYVTYFIGTL